MTSVGNFFSEAAWYKVSEAILTHTKELCCKLPENYTSTHLIELECLQRLVLILRFIQVENVFVSGQLKLGG